MDPGVAVIGAPAQVAELRLGGARAYPVEDDEQARAAWRDLSDTTVVVVLGAAAAEAVGARRADPRAPLTVVLPP